MATVLKLAVCLFPDVTALDYQGPMELLGFLSKSVQDQKFIPPSPYQIEATYVGYTKDPVVPAAGPRLLPDTTYVSTTFRFRTSRGFSTSQNPSAAPVCVRSRVERDCATYLLVMQAQYSRTDPGSEKRL